MLEQETVLKLIVLAKNGDEAAKTKLVEENSPLIKSVIKPYRNKGIDYDDLYQLGSLGFVKAIFNFDENFNVKFSTYAVPMIAGEIKRFMRDDGSIKVSRAIKTLSFQIDKFINDYKQKNFNNQPTINEIAKHFNVDEQEVVFAMDSKQALLSLDDRIDDSDSNSRSIMESIKEPDMMENVLDNLVLKDLIKNLPLRDKQIIAMRYFRDKTQSEIAKELGVSQVQVSRLENKIIEKLKNQFFS